MAPSLWTAVKNAADEEGISVADFVRHSVTFVLGARTGLRLAEHEEGTLGAICAMLGVAPEEVARKDGGG